MTGRKKWIFLSAGIAIILLFIGFNMPFQESGKSTGKPETKQSAEQSAARTVQNVRAFAKLFGYVYYFHPSDEAFVLDWERFSVYGVQQIMNAGSDKELKERLEELFHPIAPTLQIFLEGEQPEMQDLKKGDKLIAWQHLGLNMKNGAEQGYKSERIIADSSKEIKLFEQKLKAGTSVEKVLSDGLKARIPLVLYYDGDKTLGGTAASKKAFKKRVQQLAAIKHEENTRYLANTILTWNAYQHFYPYFDVVTVDWEKELDNALKGIITAKNPAEMEKSFRLMLAASGDAHNTMDYPLKKNYLAVRLEWMEEQLVVIQSKHDKVKIGDRIVAVDGVDTITYLVEAEARIPGSPQWKRYMAVEEISAVGPNENEVNLTLVRNGEELAPITLNYDGYLMDEFNREANNPIYEIEEGIYYIDLNKTRLDDVYDNIEKFASAKGVIFDYRGYPSDPQANVALMSHLIDNPVLSPQFLIPKIIYPDQEKVEFNNAQWPIEPASPKLKGKMVFLTYPRTLSMPELFLDIVKEYKLGETVGKATGGNNGGVIKVDLIDSNSSVYFTGGKVLKHDGSQHHLIGVEPTVPITRTIQAVKEGRDEYIEKALELIKR
ncbi:S41 family peptidase [Neobacillus sp. YIM B06451]|uniref:S41 family peptidase n=1 Tax=Neobacillus sp. YIM B06451 TaxID=3070994 RepID=UPI002931BBB5|nr:S41 family peptidase [Neobacillus sp. YIM B06451]